MNLKFYISFLVLMGLGLNLFGANHDSSVDNGGENELISSISVFAGNDTSICNNAYFDMTDLGAFVTGDVSDGTWFSYGDGLFTPNNAVNETFSIATGYTLGPNDILNGSVTLILVSDDPDGFGPETEVSDLLVVTLIDQPAMACVGNITLSLDNNCTQTIVPAMLLTNPEAPEDYYIINCYTESGELIPDNILTSDHVGQTIDFVVGHNCGDVTCEGSVTVLDKHIPNLLCTDSYIKCNEPFSIADIGLPIPNSASVVSHSGNVYIIDGLDPCSLVTLSYSESIQNFNCSSDYTQIITRNWQATDASNNATHCTQHIYIDRITLEEVILPTNFDGTVYSALSCDQVLDTLPNGAPSTSITGMPDIGMCSDMDVLFDDVIIPDCGSTFKVIRKWFIFDNCTNESINHNQLIKIQDSIPPIIDCPNDTLIFSTNPYTCESNVEIPLLSYEDCSAVIFNISYLADFTADTIPVNETFHSFNVVNQGDTLYMINHLPKGHTWLRYTLEDACGNKSYCHRLLIVEDHIPPYISCDGYTSVNVTNDGSARLYAWSLDDESWDNCSEITFDVIKMTDACGNNASEYSPYVDFCCEEVGETVMVQLRATDASGNVNYCMVEVTVNDKLAPTIVAPDDFTISCSNGYNPDDLTSFGKVVNLPSLVENILVYDDFNNGIVGSDGLAEDNCDVTITEEVVFDLNCEQGTITRTFTATDPGGLVASDQQVITVLNPDPFDEYDIHWPQDKTIEGCSIIVVDTTDVPTYDNLFCSEVSASYEDQVFEIVEGACTKIIRKWTVVDWCQYNMDNSTGIWVDDQVIKILNLEAPEILSACRDTSYCLFEADCGSGQLVLNIDAIDDCTPKSDLYFEWSVKDNLGLVIGSGYDSSAVLILEVGMYSVEWLVEDLCGNKSTCSYGFEVKDCKAPTPYCIGSVVTTLMDDVESIELWASDFDIGSYDNCTSGDQLVFSFSQDTSDHNRTFTCDDISNGVAEMILLEMWVTDEHGNQDYCDVNLFLQDNQDNCVDQAEIGAIAGSISTLGGQFVDDVTIDFDCLLEDYNDQTLTDANGEYVDGLLLQNINYTVKPSKDDHMKQYVSTLDLVLIQRHILRLKKLTSPYQLIAADINKSGKVNVVDIIQLRKLLLSKFKRFPQNTSWRFVDAAYSFPNEEEPWDFPDSISLRKLDQEYLETDFIGVKIGDVNTTYTELNDIAGSETRNTIEIFPSIQKLANGNIKCDLSIDKNFDLDGYQLQIRFDKDNYKFVGLAEGSMNEVVENYNLEEVQEGIIRFLYFDKVVLDEALVLTSLLFEPIYPSLTIALELSLDAHFNNELYISEQVITPFIDMGTELTALEPKVRSELASVTTYPNPFVENVFIEIRDVKHKFETLELYDIGGSLLYKEDITGKLSLELDAKVFPISGSYLVVLKGEQVKLVKKLVRL